MPARKKPVSKPRAPQSATRRDSQRTRLRPQVRREQLIDSAARLVVAQGFLPLPAERLAKAAGVSKALVYSYFPEQYALFNSLLERELTALVTGGLDTASQVRDLEQAAVLCAMIYFEHVARTGPLLNILMSDRYMSGRIERRLVRLRNVVLLRLIRLAAASLRLSKKEILAAIEMMTAIPEEAGRLVFHEELDAAVARQICRSLILSSLQALRAPDVALAGTDQVT
jgi:AcrR family transcriptional regulator